MTPTARVIRSLTRALCMAVASVVLGCSAPEHAASGLAFDEASAPPHCFGQGPTLFEDVTARAGTGHVHGVPTGTPYYHYNQGGGVVLEDLDGDGDLDLYLSNAAGPKALLLNRGDGVFEEGAASRGAAFPEDWTNGVSAADYDNDGDQDLLLLNRGANRLLRNRGDATFEDVTASAGLGDPGVGASASWADLDHDGDLDLFVANLAVDFIPTQDRLVPASSVLYRNLGDGRFEKQSAGAGAPHLPEGSSYLGALLDLDDDGWADLLLTSDFGGSPDLHNRLFRNLGPGADGRLGWSEVTATANILSPSDVMGMAVSDLDSDGLPDLLLTNLLSATPGREVLLHNLGAMRFADETEEREASAMTRQYEGRGRTASWGATTLDVENDGREDLYLVYGHFDPTPDFGFNGTVYPPHLIGQPNALLRQGQGEAGHFTLAGGSCAEEAGKGRGVAAGDLDGDGCEDLFVVNEGGPARQLRNLCRGAGHALRIKLVGSRSNRDGVGAKVTVTTGGRRQVRRVLAGATSVHSAPPKELHVGLGAAATADELRIDWPSGTVQVLRDVPGGAALRTIREP